jgi:rhamnose transport system ATP-binding protein
MSENILELRNITKSFDGVEVLHKVSFSVQPGEVHALLGENGAGKSTLVKIMTGVYKPDGGEIYLNGMQVHFSGSRESGHAGVAAIYQELSLFPHLDLAENIFIGRQPTMRGGRINWSQMYKDADELLGSLGVHMDVKQKADQLSIAQQQMVEIARALSINARILIMDEPTSSLTLNEVADLFSLVRRLRESGTAIVFISHRIEELFQIADRVTVLRDGNWVDTVLLKDVNREKLIRMMVGRKISDLFPKEDVREGKVALEVENLSREGVFEDISFKLHEGEILGMSGLVGAGRTDVAQAIFGVKPPTSGVIKIDGKEVRINLPRQAINLGIGYVPENRQLHGLVLRMQIAANISLPRLGSYAKWGWIKDKEEKLSAFTAAQQMEVHAKGIWQKARELSGGNQQKVVLAKWLSVSPRILILDEPTRGIDVGTKAAVHALMNQLASEGKAILMISSELPEILGMSDRIIVMHEGHMTGLFTHSEATQEKIMAAAVKTVKKNSKTGMKQ